MFIDKIYEDFWEGNKCSDIEYPCNDTSQVTKAINQLNGKQKTMLILTSNKQNKSLTISGGNNSRYIAYMTVGIDDEFFNLTNKETTNEQDDCEVVAGGQSGVYPIKQCLNLELIIEAGIYFSETGDMKPELIWEKDQ